MKYTLNQIKTDKFQNRANAGGPTKTKSIFSSTQSMGQ